MVRCGIAMEWFECMSDMSFGDPAMTSADIYIFCRLQVVCNEIGILMFAYARIVMRLVMSFIEYMFFMSWSSSPEGIYSYNGISSSSFKG